MQRKAKTESERQEVARRWVQINISSCDSSLVDDLLKLNGEGDLGEAFSYDAIENLYPPPVLETTCKVCGCELTRDDRDDEWTDDEAREGIDDEEDDDGNVTKEGHDHVPDLDDEEDPEEPREIYEWWRIDDYVARRLREHDCCILDTKGYGIWWGRCTTGQSICLDHVIREITKDLEWVDENGRV